MSDLPSGEVNLDTLSVNHAFITTMLRQQLLAFMQQRAFMAAELAKCDARIVQLGEAVKLREDEERILAAHQLSEDLHDT